MSYADRVDRTYVPFFGTKEQREWLNAKLDHYIAMNRAADNDTSFFYPYALAGGQLPTYTQGVFTLPLPEPMNSIKQGEPWRGNTYDLATEHRVMFTRVRGPKSEFWILKAPVKK